MIGKDQIEIYKRDGQLTPPIVLNPVLVKKIQLKMETFFLNNPELDQDYAQNLFKYDRSWVEIAALQEILDIVAQVIGDNIICWSSAFFSKKGIGGKATPWHQDACYWPIEPLETCTVWIAIDEATEENGCLQVIPGSHKKRKFFAHRRDNNEKLVLNLALDVPEAEFGVPRNVTLKPGMLSIHDAFIIHGANANNSGKRRSGLVFRYMPATSHFNRAKARQMASEMGIVDVSEREIFLLRGINLSELNDVQQYN